MMTDEPCSAARQLSQSVYTLRLGDTYLRGESILCKVVNQLLLIVEYRTNLVGIATDCCDAFHSKIERLRRETGLL
jgi:hypothetical protein